jgi:GNAT superfamily N-acetyltransferase
MIRQLSQRCARKAGNLHKPLVLRRKSAPEALRHSDGMVPRHSFRFIYGALLWRLQRQGRLRIARVRVNRFRPSQEAIQPKNPEIAVRLLDRQAVLLLSADPTSGLKASDTRQRLGQGQFFIASLADGVLVGYDWYSPTALCLEEDSVYFVFDPSLICCAYSFVHPAYRGRGLGGDRWDFAHREFAARGWRGTVYYIETRNFSSLRAASKREDDAKLWVGMFAYVRLMGRYVCWTSRGCRRLGIAVTTRVSSKL